MPRPDNPIRTLEPALQSLRDTTEPPQMERSFKGIKLIRLSSMVAVLRLREDVNATEVTLRAWGLRELLEHVVRDDDNGELCLLDFHLPVSPDPVLPGVNPVDIRVVDGRVLLGGKELDPARVLRIDVVRPLGVEVAVSHMIGMVEMVGQTASDLTVHAIYPLVLTADAVDKCSIKASGYVDVAIIKGSDDLDFHLKGRSSLMVTNHRGNILPLVEDESIAEVNSVIYESGI